MKITVEFDIPQGRGGTLTEQEISRLRILLLDALHEFSAHRSPAGVYVSHRYHDFTEDFIGRKTIDVSERVRIANLLLNGLDRITIGEEIPR